MTEKYTIKVEEGNTSPEIYHDEERCNAEAFRLLKDKHPETELMMGAGFDRHEIRGAWKYIFKFHK